MHYLLHLKNLISISSEERKKQLIDPLADQYRKSNPDTMHKGTSYTKTLFGIIEENGLFPRYFDLFQPIRFDNEFNEKLIRLLIDNNHLKPAEQYCRQQIQGNYRNEYNTPYLELLNKIYILEKDDKKRAEVLAELLPTTFDFDDFLFIYNRMPEDDEKKKWRTKILTKAQNASGNYKSKSKEFIFKLMDHEQNYKKMITTINSYTPYCLILRFFEPMARTNKDLLLKSVIEKHDDFGWGYMSGETEKDKECFPKLLDAYLKYFTESQLKKAIGDMEKQRFYYRQNQFILFMKKVLIK